MMQNDAIVIITVRRFRTYNSAVTTNRFQAKIEVLMWS